LAIQEYYREILACAGAQVSIYSNGIEALDGFLSASESYDLLLVDLGMPRMGGHELIEQVRAVNTHIPVIVCSGNDENLKAKQIEQLRIDAVLLKPVRQAELIGNIARVLKV